MKLKALNSTAQKLLTLPWGNQLSQGLIFARPKILHLVRFRELAL